jgi:DNA-binding MarR family transcriptional regulator
MFFDASFLYSDMMNVTDTYRLINEVFLLGDDIDRQILGRFALTVRQYHLLNWLSVQGSANLSELAQLLLCDKSNVTGIVRRLKAAKLIEDVPTTDRRYTRVSLTAKGTDVHKRAKVALQNSIDARFSKVTEDVHSQVQQLLAQMYNQLRGYIDDPIAQEKPEEQERK